VDSLGEGVRLSRMDANRWRMEEPYSRRHPWERGYGRQDWVRIRRMMGEPHSRRLPWERGYGWGDWVQIRRMMGEPDSMRIPWERGYGCEDWVDSGRGGTAVRSGCD